MRRYALALCFSVLPAISSAQTGISASAGASQFSIGTEGYTQPFRFYSASVEVEHQFQKMWLPGFGIGFRKEGKSKDNGTYLTARLFHAFDTKPISVIVSGGVIYGAPGIQFDRTKLVYQNGNVAGYKNVSMKRNATVPGLGINFTAIIQPTVDVRVRKYLGHLFVEGRSGLRLARFTAVSSDFKKSQYKEPLVPIPSVGLGIGFRF